jgi:hypothetical protein
MSIRTVVWVASAEEELANLWLASSDRSDVSQAADGIDTALRHHGADVGIELSEGLFAIELAPLRVLFEVLVPDAVIRVLKAKRV